MVRTMIGVDSTGIGCIKIMKSDADNPRTTPDSSRSKFLYNSKFDYTLQVSDVEVQSFLSSGTVFTPSGSANSNYQRKTLAGSGYAIYFYRKSFFAANDYNVPLFDYKMTRKSDGKFFQAMIQRRYSGKYYQDRGGYYATFFGFPDGPAWYTNYQTTTDGTLNFGTRISLDNGAPDDYNPFYATSGRLILWNLPGNSAAISQSTPIATPGLKTIKITNAALKIAKPGYNVETATKGQLAFDSSLRPTKIIAAADVALPSGNSEYDTGITLPANVAADVIFYEGSTPSYPSTFGKGVYWFEGTKIKFTSTDTGRVRFMIYMDDDSVPSSGTNKVLRQFTEGGVDVVQFLRPGSANPPRFSDIVIDSRRPGVQLLEEGYFAVANGELTTTITVPNSSGMFLFPKYLTTHGSGDGPYGSWDAMSRLPFTKKFVESYSSSNHAGDSTYCLVNAGSVSFKTFKGAPGDYYRDGNNASGGYPYRTDSVSDPIVGIRYFIFGIPS